MCRYRTNDVVSINELRDKFDYDPETGLFKKNIKNGESKKWWMAGAITSAGYCRLIVNGKSYLCHRLAYAIYYGHHPQALIDHINGNTTDNRISNLRIASHSDNLINQRVSISNKSGYKGVYFNKHHGKWHACVRVNKEKHHLGYFDTAEDAHESYQKFAKKNHGDFYSGLERSVLKSTVK